MENNNGLSTEVLSQNVNVKESAFSIQGFDHAQRIAKALAEASLVPDVYKKSISNCLIALEFANRMNASPLMVMQNLHVIMGKPSWSSPFIIASINTCGRFAKLNWRKSGEGDDYGFEAFTKDKKTGVELVGPKVTRKMVKEEGWLSKSGSKWKSMEDLMFHYRSAAFWCRLHAPELLMGMQTVEEMMDITATVIEPEQVKESKESERVELLIKDARNLQDLQTIREHVKPEQMELFNQKMQELS